MQMELDEMKNKRKANKLETLGNLKQRLMEAQKQLKSEWRQNIELNEKARELNGKEVDQSGVLETSSAELTSI